MITRSELAQRALAFLQANAPNTWTTTGLVEAIIPPGDDRPIGFKLVSSLAKRELSHCVTILEPRPGKHFFAGKLVRPLRWTAPREGEQPAPRPASALEARVDALEARIEALETALNSLTIGHDIVT